MSDQERWHHEVGRREEYENWMKFYGRGAAPDSATRTTTRTGTAMPKLSQMIESKYLSKDDLADEDGMIVTISKFKQENIARENEPDKMKWLVSFRELPKPLVLNSTNIQLLGQATGCEDTDDMVGRKVVIYFDPNVTFGGKLVGGLRLRKAKAQQPQRQAPQPAGDYDDLNPPPPADNDIPF